MKTVRSWKELARGLMGWPDYDWDMKGEKKLAAIQRQHVTDEARLKAVVESFLLGEGRYQPSWRRVIHVLHQADESHLAEKIKTNAEPHQGQWVCIIPQQYNIILNTSHMTSISNPVFIPSAIYAHSLTLFSQLMSMIQ